MANIAGPHFRAPKKHRRVVEAHAGAQSVNTNFGRKPKVHSTPKRAHNAAYNAATERATAPAPGITNAATDVAAGLVSGAGGFYNSQNGQGG